MKTATLLHTLKNRFAGVKQCVNPCFSENGKLAGKNLGGLCLLLSQGDAKSLKADLGNLLQGNNSSRNPQGNYFQGQSRHPFNPHLDQEQTMYQPLTLKSVLNTFLPKAFVISLLLGTLFFSQDLWAHDGNLLKDEITALEKLFTGGYMRLGLLGVCGFAAIYGIVKQSGWIFASGILGCIFAYFMKDWITKTFTMIA
ncbi:MAG: hypothetical protein KBD36_05465 [Alphaproteobacteria bacterium]|nr:hypothetical protein [Alphaproteobacteria bacterium]MBP9777273.1 hypothetical protein [Alphaproteobacteria bacterium]